MQPSTPPPPPPDEPYVEIRDYTDISTPEDVADLTTLATLHERLPESIGSTTEEAREEWERYSQSAAEKTIARHEALVRFVRRNGAKNLSDLIAGFEGALKTVEQSSFSLVELIRKSKEVEREMRESAKTTLPEMVQRFLAMADKSARQVASFNRQLETYYLTLRELRKTIASLREIEQSMEHLSLLEVGNFDEPYEVMDRLQTSIRNGVEIVARRLEFLARSREASPFIRALALETLAGARVHKLESLVLDAILDGIRSNDADLRFAAVAATSDLSREKRDYITRFMEDISRDDSDPNVRRAAHAFLQIRINQLA